MRHLRRTLTGRLDSLGVIVAIVTVALLCQRAIGQDASSRSAAPQAIGQSTKPDLIRKYLDREKQKTGSESDEVALLVSEADQLLRDHQRECKRQRNIRRTLGHATASYDDRENGDSIDTD